MSKASASSFFFLLFSFEPEPLRLVTPALEPSSDYSSICSSLSLEKGDKTVFLGPLLAPVSDAAEFSDPTIPKKVCSVELAVFPSLDACAGGFKRSGSEEDI